ncbi:S-adenosyl-L-methionine-dependent methyltransferase [Massarina eburnea CBS 473.64]|uniref:S-adenosyl-L-methionine-dependent methyltransferase n=1 Tax=Massarina eburnea CBS 473.64 TaxID=1395130 RepID=A0A6A6SGD7_9PLEO|nr:S-adenosyl-L-methionine-dependent methyltransferase [Massarina eburnea CBS 473.64]
MAMDHKNGSLEKVGVVKGEVNPLDISIAVRACDADAVPSVLERLSSFGKTPPVERDDIRLAMLADARTLVRALETPRETMIKHNWAQPACHAAITTCYNAGVLDLLRDGPMKVDQLASKLGMHREVLAMGYIKETDVDEYAPTNFSKALTIPIIGDGYPCLAGGAHTASTKLHEYLRQTQYATPSDFAAGPYQYAFDTEMNLFQYMHAHPPLGKQFDHHMGGYRQGRPSWMDPNFYPVKEQIFAGMDTSEDSVLLVDIGGGLGHDLGEFSAKYPDAPGRLVLQDLQVVIDGIKQLDPKIERMNHDFLTEQPLKGARAYYMHSVLHDWPDDMCANILKPLAGAMKRGYSKLLINENVIPDKDADWQATALDVLMMALFASKERTLTQWRQLLETPELGLRIVRVWSAEHSQESLIECELV